jgi:sulfopyruvate decarboxylase subunit alpha
MFDRNRNFGMARHPLPTNCAGEDIFFTCRAGGIRVEPPLCFRLLVSNLTLQYEKAGCGVAPPGGNVKREVAAEIVDSLKEAGVDFVASLTEANLHDLVIALGEDPAIHHVPVTREEEGIGICAGAYLGGKKPAMVMMNAGFLLSANALATVCIHPGIPVLMLIGHSGGVGEDNAGHATVGSLTEPILQAMHIVYEKVGRFEDIRPTIRDSQILARSSRRPTAIVLNKQALR